VYTAFYEVRAVEVHRRFINPCSDMKERSNLRGTG
jgi:hypothetical protein